jgi:hypothetical protein
MTIEINEALLEEACRVLGVRTKREAIERALQELMRQQRRRDIWAWWSSSSPRRLCGRCGSPASDPHFAIQHGLSFIIPRVPIRSNKFWVMLWRYVRSRS